MRKNIFCKILLCGCLVISCEKIEPEIISNGGFSLQLFSDWKYKALQGIDSYEGVFTNCHEEITYSGLLFGFDDLSSIVQTPETLYFEDAIIDGEPAKIIKRKYGAEEYLFLEMDAKDKSVRIQLSVTNPDDDQKFITIFKSLRFI